MKYDSIPDAATIRKHLLERDAWFNRVCGPTLPPTSQNIMAHADDLVQQWHIDGHAIAYESGSSTSWHQGISPKSLPALAAAYALKKDLRHATLAKAIYLKVMTAEPWHEGWLPKHKFQPLIIPHRLGDTETPGWFGALPAFLHCELFDDAFVRSLVRSAVAQLNYLQERLHPGRNIRLTQADALLTQSINLAFVPEAKQWLSQGVLVLNDGFHRLIAPDGASREATAWYHAILMHMAMRLWRLKNADATLGLTITAEKIAPMFDYTLACIEPDGKATRIGDSVGNITPDGSLASFINLREKCLTELGCVTTLPATAQLFNHVNQAMIRSDWTADANYLTFDATTRYGHHWHPGRNSIQLVLQGQRVVADPGRMNYDPTPHRAYALSTRGHTTLNLNGQQQADTPAQLRHQQTKDAQFLDGVYAGGYWPIENSHHYQGTYARHQRSVLWLQNRFVLVIDHLAHTQGESDKPSVEVLWHFAPGVVTLDNTRRSARSTHGSNKNVHMDLHTLLCPSSAVMSLHQGQLEPDVLGWVANDRTDTPEPAPSVMLRIAEQDQWRLDLATLLVPGSNHQKPLAITQTTSHDASEKPYAYLSVTWANGERDRFWWTRDLLAALDEIPLSENNKLCTDASLLHLHDNAAGKPVHLTLIDGTFARAHDKSCATSISDTPCMRCVEL